MRLQITAVLLFLFSFVIAHDTVMVVIADKSPSHEMYQSTTDTMSAIQLQLDPAQLHAMFHFVAVETESYATFPRLCKHSTASYYHLRQTLFEQETSFKPPKA